MIEYLRKFLSSQGLINLGLLCLRVAIGIMLIMHGALKLTGGPDKWESIGSNMLLMGVGFGFSLFGLMAGIIEVFAGALIAIGFLSRPASLLLIFVLFIAFLSKSSGGFVAIAHPLEVMLIFIFLLIAGPGKYSYDRKFFG